MPDTSTVLAILIGFGIAAGLWAARRIILKLIGVGVFVLIVLTATRPGFGEWLEWTWEVPDEPLQSCLSIPSGAVTMEFAFDEQFWVDKYYQAKVIGPADGNNIAAAGLLLYVIQHPELKDRLNTKAGLCHMAIRTNQGWVGLAYMLKNDNSIVYYFVK